MTDFNCKQSENPNESIYMTESEKQLIQVECINKNRITKF
jgi:hypothetical protein